MLMESSNSLSRWGPATQLQATMTGMYQRQFRELEAAKNEAERQLRAGQQAAGAILACKRRNILQCAQ